MTLRRAFTVECDQCAATATVHGVSKKKALRLFRNAAWDIGKGNVADLCPPCSRTD